MTGRQVVYRADTYIQVAAAGQVDQLLDWLRANAIDPDCVPQDRDVVVETGPDGERVIRYTHWLRTAEGYLLAGDDGPAGEERTVPLLVDPPEHWPA